MCGVVMCTISLERAQAVPTEVLDATDRVDNVLEDIRLRVTREVITDQINEFIDVIATDDFVDYVNGIGELPSHAARKEATARTAQLSTLESMGVVTPDDLRISTREFELPGDGATANSPLPTIRPGLDPRMGFCVSLGFYLCVSYGG